MSKVLTLLTSATAHPLVKSFSGPDVIQRPFSTGKLFNVSEEPVSDLQSLSALLQRLENDPTHTVIRGSLTDDQSSPVPRNKEAFIATPRQWCMIDIDSLAWNGDLSDQQAMLSYAIQQLPAEFQAADFWYQFSSSMGIKSGINAHLFMVWNSGDGAAMVMENAVGFTPYTEKDGQDFEFKLKPPKRYGSPVYGLPKLDKFDDLKTYFEADPDFSPFLSELYSQENFCFAPTSVDP